MTKKRGNRRKVVGEDRVELVMSLGDLSKIRPIQNGSKTGFQILTTKRFTGSRPCRSRCFFAFVARSCIGSLLRRTIMRIPLYLLGWSFWHPGSSPQLTISDNTPGW
ncbi:uncharacterized protein LOC110103388 isoform X1 [Dendrobium catenatum]|uniref:uncharacterized protein LOC110103388 isoform X1 n=1 Tax=Dendrobium catenatum TaxID=906689 RepID=UPI00109EF80C|nr:uncharacterized protein LOC110103388 isoform X1 [Dendrobium catenatum]